MRKLDIRLHPSKLFTIFQSGLLLVSLLVIFCLPLLVCFKIALSFVVIFYSLFIYYNQRELTRLSHDQEGWCIETLGGKFSAELSGDSTITTWLSVLRFEVPGKFWKRSYVVFKDAMLGDDYRKLIVHAKWLSK